MARHCVAAGCDSVGGKGCSLHKFTHNEVIRKKWIKAVKQQRSSWDSPLSHSLLCSKHFTDNYFPTEGVCFHDKNENPDSIMS